VTGDPAGRLRRLDDRWLPRLARRLRVLTAGLRRTGRRPFVRLVGDAATSEPALAGSIVAVAVAGALLAGIGEPAASRDDGGDTGRTLPATPIVATVGPTPGTSVASYLTRASFDLRHFGEISHGAATYAVVDLRSFQTPTQARALFGAVQVVRAYVRVQVHGVSTPVRSVPVQSAALLPAGMRTAATVASATAKSYAVLVAGLHPRTKADRRVKQRYTQMHRAAVVEAAALRRPLTCRCVFAVVVHADAVRLSTLATEPQIRVVDPGPPEVELTGLTALPLDPRVTRRVPGTGLPSG
jgi:hypothetical protein